MLEFSRTVWLGVLDLILGAFLGLVSSLSCPFCHTFNREMRRSSNGESFRPPFLAFVSGVLTANVITCFNVC